MLVAWLDFCSDTSIRPNDQEQSLFRRMHAPQYNLGGLPIVFLGPPQLRFIESGYLNVGHPKGFWNPMPTVR